MNDESLSEFIERAARLGRQKSQTLTAEEIRAIALESGLSEEDLEEASRKGRNALQRGREFMARRRWRDAIAELEDALALLPAELGPRIDLARAFAERFLSTGDRQARTRAESLARRILDVDPGCNAAYEVLDLISAKVPDGGPNAGDKNSKSPVIMVVAAALAVTAMITILAVMSSIFLFATGDSPEPAPEPTPTPTPVSELPQLDEIEASNDESRQGTHELDVEVVDDTGRGVGLDVRGSVLDVYDDSSFYKLQALATNDGDYEIEKLRAKLEFFDDDDDVIATESGRRILDNHQATIRPGDAHAFDILVSTNPNAVRVRFTYEWSEATPAASEYAASRPVEIEQAPGQDRWKLDVRERESSWQEYSFGDEGHLRATFEVTNAGGGAIRLLLVQIDLFNENGEKIAERDNYVVTSGGPPMPPEETRLFSTITAAPLDYDHYRLVVSSIR